MKNVFPIYVIMGFMSCCESSFLYNTICYNISYCFDDFNTIILRTMGDISSAYLEELSIAASHTHTKIELEVSETEENLKAKRQTLLLICLHNPGMLWWAPPHLNLRRKDENSTASVSILVSGRIPTSPFFIYRLTSRNSILVCLAVIRRLRA